MALKQLLTVQRRNLLLATSVLLSAVLALAEPEAKPTTRPAPAANSAPSDPVSKLRAALPAGWSLWGSSHAGRTALHPGLQWSRVPTGFIKLRSTLIPTKEGLQRATPPVIVWTAQRQAVRTKRRTSEIQLDIEQKPTTYLGGGSEYHVYIHIPSAVMKLWPTARRDIAKAFGIKTATTQPADAVEKRSTVLITQKGNVVSYAVNDVACADIKTVAQALGQVAKDTPLVIQIETNVRAGHVAEVLAIVRKLRLMKVSITVVRTSRPPVKPEKRLPL
ncbi:MAG: hypothetical protein QGG42_02350 [Phycisphaerae bacterium]|nr:hypothetical protein [Phycisphaerae bacterium]